MMDENEKKLLENLRNFDISNLFMPNTYVDFEFKDLYESFICRIESDGKYNIYIQKNKSNISAPKNMLRFYGENNHYEKNKLRESNINPFISESDMTDIIKGINTKLKEINITLPDDISESGNDLNATNNLLNENLVKEEKTNILDITGYITFQLLEGSLNDCLFIIKENFVRNRSLNFNEKELLYIIIDIIIYCANVVENNLKYYKNAYYNRKLLIVSQTHAILASFDSLISNLSPFYKICNNTYVDLNKKLKKVINSVYNIILESKKANSIPLQSLIIFIKLITFHIYNGNIENYNKNEVYLILKNHMKNLDKNELIFFKSDSSIKEICNELINNLFNYNSDSYINEIYYSYLFSCLKCDNLEKKINAINEMNNIINSDFSKNKNINEIFKDFIDKNNILDMFFDDNTHEEIIKRAGDLFKYLAKFDCLNNNIIEKLIEKQKSNNLMTDILIEIISELPDDKKNDLFNRLTKGIKLDDINSNNIEYISRLTISCFNSTKLQSSLDNEETEIKIMEEESNNNYYGLSILFNYILYNFNEKKSYDENNVDKAIITFENTIEEIGENSTFGKDDIHSFLDKLFENIKSNDKHNSIVQSIKLIQKLLFVIERVLEENPENILKNLDKKYDIITLLIDDLIRYLNISDNIYSAQKIYEGIYPHNISIEQRLIIIFYFLKKNYDFMVQGKKHLEKLFDIFKPEKYKEERKKFYEILSKSIGKLNNELLTEFYKDILQNKEEFDLTVINDNESINLIIQIFKQINYNKSSIMNDGRIIRISENAVIEGLNMLFTLLTQNPNDFIQEKISELLCNICLYHKNYSSELLPSYWVDFFNKINVYLEEIIKTNDKIMLNGTLKLIDKIYKKCGHLEGEIVGKNEYKSPKKFFKEYHFINIINKKQYKLKAGFKDKFIELRYKISFYYDIPVNNVCMMDLDGNEYNLNNDFDIFVTLFDDEKYFYKKGFECIRVKVEPFDIEKIKDNPKMLIEKDEKIYDILIKNLSCDSKEDNFTFENKETIWNILSPLPKLFYFENNLKKFGMKEKIEEKELSEIFNIKNIYIFTYYLQCIYHFLLKKNVGDDIKEEYLNNFIEIHHIDKLIIDNLLNVSIDRNNCNIIKFNCLISIINMTYKIEEYKKNRKEYDWKKIMDQLDLMNDIFKKFTDIIAVSLTLNNKNNENFYFHEGIDSNLEKNIILSGKIIFRFIKYISNGGNNYINFIFKDAENFIKIFVKDFIKCENEELKEVIVDFFSVNFQNNSENFFDYLKIVLTEELFTYLVKYDETGKYFNVISSIITNYFEKKERKELDLTANPEFLIKLKKLVDLILNYIEQEELQLEKSYELNDKDNKTTNNNEKEKLKLLRNKEFFKEELFLFLSNIINLQPKELVNYIINKIDICDFFLIKCNLRKCVQNPLETPDSFCLKSQSKTSVHKLILNIIRNSDNENQIKLYKKVLDILDNLNKTGFWKTYNFSNWDIEYEEMQKTKYVGLKNMTSTCYLNSIIQQLFMIPTFRETIIKIENPSTNNILYELQLLFSALKIYENPYYDPRSFVIANNLNFTEQMDADEFYGILIDKIEKDIKEIYCPKIEDKTMEKKEDTYKYKDIFNYFFGIKVLDELRFTDCGHKRYNEFCYYNIQIEIKNCNNIYESLNNYFKAEIMDGDNKINCEECKTKRACHKHLLLKSLPNILVISLKRFEFDYETMLKFKLNKYFEFPFQLNMKDYMIESHVEKSTEYDLTGIVVHNGESDFGHYYDLIKGPDNKWYKFNDEMVSVFKEEDIPNEAFGNKDDDDDDSEKEKETGKRNAYILFYTKRTNVNIEELKKYDLSLPPYDKESNIKKEIKEIINLKLYKSWIIKNIFSPWYQNFVLGLFKINYEKKIQINNMESVSSISDDESEKEENKDNKENNKKDNVYNIDEMDDKVFKFVIRYYFNVVCRISKRNMDKNSLKLRQKFQEILVRDIENNINKMKFILEEFSNSEAIDEYLIYCPSKSDVSFCSDLIIKILSLIYQKSDMYDENNFCYLFLNTWITYIAKNIRIINLEKANNVFYEMLKLNTSLLLQYLKEKNLYEWILSFIRSDATNQAFNSVFNEKNLPTIHSGHSILIEKTMNPEEKYENLRKKNIDEEKDILDIQLMHNLKDMQSNNTLLVELKQNL